MHPKQLALLEGVLDAVLAECLRSPVATLNGGHLKAVLVERLLRDGAGVLERGATAREAKLLRLMDEVVKVERVERVERRAVEGLRPQRLADLRVAVPIRLELDLYARSALAGPDRTAGRALLDRLQALAAGASDALLLACDRRGYDALRIVRSGDDAQPPVLASLCAALLPPSTSLATEPVRSAPALNGRPYSVLAAVTPMVFGAQRVAAVVWPVRRPALVAAGPLQLDAFAE
jgi:hypothetical protein